MRKPNEPVSSSTWSIVAQVVGVFGLQTVTETVGMLMMPATPRSTLTATVLAAVAAIGCWLGPLLLLFDEDDESPPPPPPQPAANAVIATTDTASTALTTRTHASSFNANRMMGSPVVTG